VEVKPELPEPAAERLDDGVITPYFTEAQLLAYRDAVIEMCAKLVEKDPLRKGWALAQDLRGLK
jgi:hypothetical protein